MRKNMFGLLVSTGNILESSHKRQFDEKKTSHFWTKAKCERIHLA